MYGQQNIRFEFVWSAKISSPIFPFLYGHAISVQLIISGKRLTVSKPKSTVVVQNAPGDSVIEFEAL